MKPNRLKRRLRLRFSKAFPLYEAQALIQKEMATELVHALEALKRKLDLVLEIGAGTGLFSREALRRLVIRSYLASDIVPESGDYLRGLPLFFVAADGEDLSWIRGKFDLIVSNATFQWFLNPRKAFVQMAGRLTPGGILAFTTFGPETMAEVFTAAKRPGPILSREEIKAIKEDYFISLKERTWQKKLYFSSPREVLNHIRATGAMGHFRPLWSLKDLRKWEMAYQRLAGPRGLPLTYQPMLFVWERRR